MKLSAPARRRFAEHEQLLKEDFPTLTLAIDEEKARASILGQMSVPVGAGSFGSFGIEIRYQGLNPFALPDTYDAEGRFDPHPDRHILDEGRFCMWLPETAPTDFDRPEGLALHLERTAEFIILQLMYEDRIRRGLTPAWPGPAWAHGEAGHRQWVREQVVDLTSAQLSNLLDAIPSAPHPGARCPCGSGRAYGKCHRQWASTMRRMVRYPGVRDELLRCAKRCHAGSSRQKTGCSGGWRSVDFARGIRNAQESWKANRR